MNLIEELGLEKCQAIVDGAPDWANKFNPETNQYSKTVNVVFLGAIPHEELKELYRVAKVHALVSWMETPGLSSLEAAAMGCNIVVTKKGDTEEYFEDFAFYCEPDDVSTIKEAIDKAYSSPFKEELRNKILMNYTWEKAAESTLRGYYKALGNTTGF